LSCIGFFRCFPVLCLLLTTAGQAQGLADRPLAERFHIETQPYSQMRDRWSFFRRFPYERALARFPDIASCRADETQGEGEIFNWDALRSTAAVEICLFLQAEDPGSSSAFVAWLREERFDVLTFDAYRNAMADRTTLVSASWAPNWSRPSYFSRLRAVLNPLLGYGHSFGIWFNSADLPISVNMTINRL
jgi:hypothetical protein